MPFNLPIIIIPGLGTSPRTYSNILPELWQHGSITIANQMKDNSMEAIAKRILAEAPKEFAIIGHSMGGYIAFEILRQAPERVIRLALLNTSARPDGELAKEKRNTQIRKAKEGKFSEIIETTLEIFVHPSNKDDKQLQKIITDAHNDAGAEAYINQQNAILNRKDSIPDLKNIKIPTLVLTGNEDMLIPLEFSQEIVESIKGANLVIIGNAGHMSVLEQPKAVNAALAEWLDN